MPEDEQEPPVLNPEEIDPFHLNKGAHLSSMKLGAFLRGLLGLMLGSAYQSGVVENAAGDVVKFPETPEEVERFIQCIEAKSEYKKAFKKVESDPAVDGLTHEQLMTFAGKLMKGLILEPKEEGKLEEVAEKHRDKVHLGLKILLGTLAGLAGGPAASVPTAVAAHFGPKAFVKFEDWNRRFSMEIMDMLYQISALNPDDAEERKMINKIIGNTLWGFRKEQLPLLKKFSRKSDLFDDLSLGSLAWDAIRGVSVLKGRKHGSDDLLEIDPTSQPLPTEGHRTLVSIIEMIKSVRKNLRKSGSLSTDNQKYVDFSREYLKGVAKRVALNRLKKTFVDRSLWEANKAAAETFVDDVLEKHFDRGTEAEKIRQGMRARRILGKVLGRSKMREMQNQLFSRKLHFFFPKVSRVKFDDFLERPAVSSERVVPA